MQRADSVDRARLQPGVLAAQQASRPLAAANRAARQRGCSANAMRSAIVTCESSNGTSNCRSSGSRTLSSSSSELARTSSSDDRRPMYASCRPTCGSKQCHQPEDAIELLLHRVLHGLQHLIVFLQALLQRTEHLIRAVVPGNLCGQQQVDRAGVKWDVRMHDAQLIERRDDTMTQRDIGLQQAADECLLGLCRADSHENGRQLAANVERRVLVAQPFFDLRDDRRCRRPRSAAAASSASLGRSSADNSGSQHVLAGDRPSRIVCLHAQPLRPDP